MRLGNYDTAYKLTALDLDVMIDSPAGNLGSAATFGRFDSRGTNSINYESPAVAGLKGLFSYSPDEAKNGTNKTVTSLAGIYEANGLKAALAVQKRADVTALGHATGVDGDSATAVKANVGYTLGNLFVAGGVEQIKSKKSGASDRKQTGLLLASTYKLNDQLTARGWVSSVGKLDGAAAGTENDYKATGLGLGATYDLSKRTYLLGYFTKVSNKTKASFGANNYLTKNTNDGGITVSAGADPQSIGFGIRHSF